MGKQYNQSIYTSVWLTSIYVILCGPLVPVFYLAIPASGDHFAGLMRMPEGTDADAVVRLPLLVHLRRLPVPNITFAIAIARHQIAHVRRKVQLAGVARDHVTGEGLFAVHLEAIEGGEDDDLVVQRLAGHPFAIGRQCDRRHGMHSGIGNVLHVHRNVPLPYAHRFVVRGGHKPSVVIHKGDGAHRSQVPVVFLYNITAASVPLRIDRKTIVT